MLFDQFTNQIRSSWTNYFARIADLQTKGQVQSTGIIFYPNILLTVDTANFYIAELIGARRQFEGLTTRKHRETSIYRFLSQFDDSEPDPLITLNAAGNGFRWICMGHDFEIDALEARFPFLRTYGSRLKRSGGHGSVLGFGDSFQSCFFENSALINKKRNLFRCKNILELIIVRRNIKSAELKELLRRIIDSNEVKGVHTLPDERAEMVTIAGHLQSLYLTPRVRETTIGEYFNRYPEVIKQAFDASSFVYEPYLDWIEHDGTVEEKAINPDLIVKRKDGITDIYDLKTAALERASITKGKRSRRRFIDYVNEGIAQLANYRRYFSFAKNREFAARKYGMDIVDPGLVLVVGNWDNTKLQEVEEARLPLENVSIIDFDTLVQSFLRADSPSTSENGDNGQPSKN